MVVFSKGDEPAIFPRQIVPKGMCPEGPKSRGRECRGDGKLDPKGGRQWGDSVGGEAAVLDARQHREERWFGF